MFIIDEKKFIHVNRGDSMEINFKQKIAGEKFSVGDVFTLNIMPKGNENEIILTKSFTIDEEEDIFSIFISSEDTKSLCDPFKSGTKTFWYEIELISGDVVNTILGYDRDGAKEFILYPEGTSPNTNV